jgi:GMP synthase (glutamine-hydrolysing)
MSEVRSHVLVIQVRADDQSRKTENLLFRRCVRTTTPLEFVNAYVDVPEPDILAARGVIIAGSPLSVFEPGVPNASKLEYAMRLCLRRKIPLLGICFGAQFIAHAMGGEVVRSKDAEEQGTFEMMRHAEGHGDELLVGIPKAFPAVCAHQDAIKRLPANSTCLASSDRCLVQAFRLLGERVWGLQFHPERKDASDEWTVAAGVLPNFVERICLG